jgi:hypothetical protein
MTSSDQRWCTMVMLAICWCSTPFHSWAQNSSPTPRCSATTEQHIREEVRYLQEEANLVAAHHDPLVVHLSVDSDVTDKMNFQSPGTASVPTELQQEHRIRMVALSRRELVTLMQGHPITKGRHTPALVP